MKHTFLSLSALFVIATLCFSCSPDDEDNTPQNAENTQSQFKPLKIIVSIDDEIRAPINPNDPGDINSLGIEFRYAYPPGGCIFCTELSSTISDHLGLNSVEFNGTAVPNTSLNMVITYKDWWYENFTMYHDCDEVTVSIYYDNVLVYQESKIMGGLSSDGWPEPCTEIINWYFLEFTL
jgi:hypothetical protein